MNEAETANAEVISNQELTYSIEGWLMSDQSAKTLFAVLGRALWSVLDGKSKVAGLEALQASLVRI